MIFMKKEHEFKNYKGMAKSRMGVIDRC